MGAEDQENPHPYEGQGSWGWHFCQRSKICYHPQAMSTGASEKSSNDVLRRRLPRPDECTRWVEERGLDGQTAEAEYTCVTDRCDDYAGKASTEGDDRAGAEPARTTGAT